MSTSGNNVNYLLLMKRTLRKDNLVDQLFLKEGP